MELVDTLQSGEKSALIKKVSEGLYIVEYTNGELFVNAGYFSTHELAEDKVTELFNAESISGEMLAGDVPAE